MSDAIRRESPLARFDLIARVRRAVVNAGVAIGERPLLGYINLRGVSADSRFVAAVRGIAGVAPPDTPNTVAGALGNVVYWLGPDEWMIVTTAGRQAEIERSLRAALRGLHSAVNDVSGGKTLIEISGAAARDVLAKGCPLDLHPRTFGIGQCAQSHLAKAWILLRIVNTTPAFEIVVGRSYADYVWLWLNDAAAEVGIEALDVGQRERP
jgi:sarcosine oxidase subunit gamma